MPFVHLVVFSVIRPRRKMDPIGRAIALRRNQACHSNALYARQALHSLHNLARKFRHPRLAAFVYLVRSDHAHGRHLIRIEAQRHMQQAIKALPQQSGSSQEHHGDCQLNHYKIGPQLLP